MPFSLSSASWSLERAQLGGGWVECSEGIWDLMKTPRFAPLKLKSYCGVSTRQSRYFPGSWSVSGVGAKPPCCLLCPVSSGQNGQTTALGLSAGGGVAGLWAHCGCSKAGVPWDQPRTLRLQLGRVTCPPPTLCCRCPSKPPSRSFWLIGKSPAEVGVQNPKSLPPLRVLYYPMLL